MPTPTPVRKKKNRHRDQLLTVFLTRDEYARLKREAAAADRNMSQHVRELVLPAH